MLPSVLLLTVATLLQSLRGHHMPTSGGLFSHNLRKTYPLAFRGEGCWIIADHALLAPSFTISPEECALIARALQSAAAKVFSR